MVCQNEISILKKNRSPPKNALWTIGARVPKKWTSGLILGGKHPSVQGLPRIRGKSQKSDSWFFWFFVVIRSYLWLLVVIQNFPHEPNSRLFVVIRTTNEW